MLIDILNAEMSSVLLLISVGRKLKEGERATEAKSTRDVMLCGGPITNKTQGRE